MIRVVMDTNVLVSATLQDKGLPAAILDLAIHKAIQLFVSEEVLAEYREVLIRPRLKISPKQIARSLAVIRDVSIVVKPQRRFHEIKNDEPDNRLLECAFAADANYLVTGNTRHFPKVFKTTKIVTPKQFVEIILPQLAKRGSVGGQ